MKKIVLAFPSKADMAEFVIACKITHVHTDAANCKLTGIFNEACLAIGRSRYGAVIDKAVDYLSADESLSDKPEMDG